MTGYSEDLRKKLVRAVERGMSKAQAARTFDVSLSSIKRYVNKANRGEPLAPKKSPGPAPKLDEKTSKLLLQEDLKERPYATLQERCDYIRALTGLSVSRSTMSCCGMGPSLAVEGATTARVFETYIEKVLAPTLRAGQIVVMDNLSAHKAKRIRQLIEGHGCELLYLPAYSPDFNPIEEAFIKIKGFLRKVGARTREALVEAIAKALDTVTAKDACGFTVP